MKPGVEWVCRSTKELSDVDDFLDLSILLQISEDSSVMWRLSELALTEMVYVRGLLVPRLRS